MRAGNHGYFPRHFRFQSGLGRKHPGIGQGIRLKELIALSAITCPAKLCETCQKNFPPFFDVKIEEIML